MVGGMAADIGPQTSLLSHNGNGCFYMTQPHYCKAPPERRGSSCSAGCTQTQPGKPIIRPFRGAKQTRPECLQVPTQTGQILFESTLRDAITMVHEESGHDKNIVRPHWADIMEDTAALEQTTRASTHLSLTYALLSRLFLFACQNGCIAVAVAVAACSRRRRPTCKGFLAALQRLPGRTSRASGPHFGRIRFGIFSKSALRSALGRSQGPS